ncbi:hypothetical protein POM88_040918 [Heracleum sosnowskyi]|uniref:Uncharacterized protein n=1 Tax=Heracleum sosnowskyi TaxID=360622 RepID=A0AAD8MAA5_9APIA|nr:hypothetical protein POM88_040918 [Heracleum sosnowskyi]
METYMLVKELSTGNTNGYIKVRVIREWEVKNAESSHVMFKNYILVDEEGTQIQATPLQSSLIKLFTTKLVLGKVHMISNYNVTHAANKYRSVPGEYLIKFHRSTKVDPINDIPKIPRYKFQMTKFEEARRKIGEIKNLMDIGGKLIKTTGLQTTDKDKKIVDLLLENERDDTIKITLWEDQAREFLQLEHEYRKANVFVIVTSTSPKLVQGEPVLWSTYSTKFYFNIDHPDLVELRGNCKLDENRIPEIVQTLDTQKNDATEKIEKVKIEKLFDAQLPPGESFIKFTTEATVVGVDPSKKWYYTGCSKCNNGFKDAQICSKCKEITTLIPLFRVTVEVRDSNSQTTFVLFEKHVQKLINVSAQHILTNDKNANTYVVPAVLNNILGKTCVFKLILDKGNTEKKYENYTVTDVQEIAVQDSNAAASEIVTIHEISHQEGEPTTSQGQNKRKLEEKYLEDGLPDSKETCEIATKLEKSATNNTANTDTGDQNKRQKTQH